ncbi:MAG: hypothetical protein HKN09_13355 [Saprospiraceae bacterium]|nr:hypothetical protein [Saprospiraceae bacterium]
MNDHFKLSDHEFEKVFADCSLPVHLFNHEAHLRLAWIKIKKLGSHTAEQEIQKQLKNYVDHYGASEKYHVTLTVAAVKIVDHFIRKSEASCFKSLLQEFPRLKHNFRDLIEAHYGDTVYESDDARLNYMAPPILPFT